MSQAIIVSIEAAQNLIAWLAERRIEVDAITVGDVAIRFKQVAASPKSIDYRAVGAEDVYRQYGGPLFAELEQDQASTNDDE